MKILPSIRGPADVKRLTRGELEALADEIRQEIVATVAANGGHLAPSLGVVELTLALHRVFNSPVDKIIWDVGHQCYAHKLITGRRDRFRSLRQRGGISGFPKRRESPHDVFETGHSSTSIAAALGMAKARDLAGEDFSVVAVIGDGALTGGMAFEALNNAGHLGTRLIVVLNDNSMSIAPNVGALASYLSRLRSDPTYARVKADLEHALRRIPVVGDSVSKAAERLKDSLKYLVVPGMLFEELGFTYLGPVDGHNLTALESVLRQASSIRGPVLVHVITRKGKGYAPAERNPDRFHGTGPFEVKTGEAESSASSGPSYGEIFGQTMIRLAEEEPRLVAITAAMPDGTGLKPFARRFPDRFFDVGIAEQCAVTFAAGLATCGYKPVVAIYSTFLQRAYDQIIHDICLQDLAVVFAVDRAGLVGDDGATHQGIFDISFLRAVPNLTVMAPADGRELSLMLRWAIGQPGPVALRYPRGRALSLERTPEPIRRATGEVLRQGTDVWIVALGPLVGRALEAARRLAERGISCGVFNARFAKPLPEKELLDFVSAGAGLVTLEENVASGGFGAAVLECLNRRAPGLEGRVVTLSLPDRFIDHGKVPHQLDEVGLGVEDIVAAASSVAAGGRPREVSHGR